MILNQACLILNDFDRSMLLLMILIQQHAGFMIFKKMLDFDDFGAACWILMISSSMPQNHQNQACLILMILGHAAGF